MSSDYQVKTQMAADVQDQDSWGGNQDARLLLETQWSLSVYLWLSLHLFFFAMEHLILAPSGVQGLPVFHSAKIFAFRKGVMIGLGALPLTPLEFLAYMYWGKALRLLGGRYATVGSWRRCGDQAKLPNSQPWFRGRDSQCAFWTRNISFACKVIRDAGSQAHPWPAESNPLEVGISHLEFYKHPGWFWCMVKFRTMA